MKGVSRHFAECNTRQIVPLPSAMTIRDENGRKRTEKPISRFCIRILSSETGSGPK
jgi:hypothetical protein